MTATSERDVLGHPAPEPTMNGAPALANRPTGRELCNYHIPATTPANGRPRSG